MLPMRGVRRASGAENAAPQAARDVGQALGQNPFLILPQQFRFDLVVVPRRPCEFASLRGPARKEDEGARTRDARGAQRTGP